MCWRLQELLYVQFDLCHTLVRGGDALVEALERWSEVNIDFHMHICSLGGTMLVKPLLANVLDHWGRLRRQYLRNVTGQLETRQEEHRQLLKALRARDPAQVARILREHNHKALSEYFGYLEERHGPEWAAPLGDQAPLMVAALFGQGVD